HVFGHRERAPDDRTGCHPPCLAGVKLHQTHSVIRRFVFPPAALLGTPKSCRVQPDSSRSYRSVLYPDSITFPRAALTAASNRTWSSWLISLRYTAGAVRVAG